MFTVPRIGPSVTLGYNLIGKLIQSSTLDMAIVELHLRKYTCKNHLVPLSTALNEAPPTPGPHQYFDIIHDLSFQGQRVCSMEADNTNWLSLPLFHHNENHPNYPSLCPDTES